MQHLFVKYTLALKLKEAGFNEPCLAIRIKKLPDDITIIGDVPVTPDDENNFVHAPIYQQVFDWFESKDLFINCRRLTGHWMAQVESPAHFLLWKGLDERELPLVFADKKQAWDAAIEQALKILKQRA